MKIEKSSLADAANVLNWLVQNVGPRLPNAGTNLNGLGWCIRPNSTTNTYIIELNQHVDDETVMMFALKWS